MDLDDVQALSWVADHGSLLAAARAHDVSRSTLRRRLQRLASTVGRPVVVPAGNVVRVSPAGQTVLAHASELLERRDAVVQSVQAALRQTEGALRVVMASGFPPMLAAQVVASVAAAHPGVTVDLAMAASPFDDLAADVDLVVCWEEITPPATGWSRVFWRAPVDVVASEDYLRRHGTPGSVSALAEHALLADRTVPARWPLRTGGTLPFAPTHWLPDAYTLGCAAAAGAGLALIPRDGIGVHPEFARLRSVLPDVLGGLRGVRYHVPIATRHHPAVAALVAHMEQLANALEPDDTDG